MFLQDGKERASAGKKLVLSQNKQIQNGG